MPVFASVIALLNDARFRAGKSALGFLNPWRKYIISDQIHRFQKARTQTLTTFFTVYSTAFTALTDITAGGSVGCNGINGQTEQPVVGGSIIPYASWNATTGWDPVTGLGVPNFEKLLKLALEL